MYKVIIAGCRDFSDYDLLKERCDYYLSKKRQEDTVVILSGAAQGADVLGERYAQENGLAIERHPADWKKNGRAAGPIRNAEMAKVADALIAFWDGKSKGTKSMIDLARRNNVPTRIVDFASIERRKAFDATTSLFIETMNAKGFELEFSPL